MHIVRGPQSNTHRQWEIKSGSREYRAVCDWSVGDMRMTWLVETYIKVAQGTSHWRRIEGREVINAVREFENNLAHLSA